MEAVQVSSDVVETILRSLDEHKSSGPDELHPKILKFSPRLLRSRWPIFLICLWLLGQYPTIGERPQSALFSKRAAEKYREIIALSVSPQLSVKCLSPF